MPRGQPKSRAPAAPQQQQQDATASGSTVVVTGSGSSGNAAANQQPTHTASSSSWKPLGPVEAWQPQGWKQATAALPPLLAALSKLKKCPGAECLCHTIPRHMCLLELESHPRASGLPSLEEAVELSLAQQLIQLATQLLKGGHNARAFRRVTETFHRLIVDQMDSSSSGSSSDADADSIGSSSCTRDADDSSSACDDDGTSSTYDEEADRAACERLAERERAAAAQWRLRAAHLQLVLDITKSGLPAAIVAALKRVKVLWMLGHRAMDTLAYDLDKSGGLDFVLAGKSGRELLQLMRANGPVPQADMDLARECYDWAATFNALSQAGGADVLELGSNPKLNSPAFAVAEAVLAVAEVAAHHIHGMAGLKRLNAVLAAQRRRPVSMGQDELHGLAGAIHIGNMVVSGLSGLDWVQQPQQFGGSVRATPVGRFLQESYPQLVCLCATTIAFDGLQLWQLVQIKQQRDTDAQEQQQEQQEAADQCDSADAASTAAPGAANVAAAAAAASDAAAADDGGGIAAAAAAADGSPALPAAGASNNTDACDTTTTTTSSSSSSSSPASSPARKHRSAKTTAAAAAASAAAALAAEQQLLSAAGCLYTQLPEWLCSIPQWGQLLMGSWADMGFPGDRNGVGWMDGYDDDDSNRSCSSNSSSTDFCHRSRSASPRFTHRSEGGTTPRGGGGGASGQQEEEEGGDGNNSSSSSQAKRDRGRGRSSSRSRRHQGNSSRSVSPASTTASASSSSSWSTLPSDCNNSKFCRLLAVQLQRCADSCTDRWLSTLKLLRFTLCSQAASRGAQGYLSSLEDTGFGASCVAQLPVVLLSIASAALQMGAKQRLALVVTVAETVMLICEGCKSLSWGHASSAASSGTGGSSGSGGSGSEQDDEVIWEVEGLVLLLLQRLLAHEQQQQEQPLLLPEQQQLQQQDVAAIVGANQGSASSAPRPSGKPAADATPTATAAAPGVVDEQQQERQFYHAVHSCLQLLVQLTHTKLRCDIDNLQHCQRMAYVLLLSEAAVRHLVRHADARTAADTQQQQQQQQQASSPSSAASRPFNHKKKGGSGPGSNTGVSSLAAAAAAENTGDLGQLPLSMHGLIAQSIRLLLWSVRPLLTRVQAAVAGSPAVTKQRRQRLQQQQRHMLLLQAAVSLLLTLSKVPAVYKEQGVCECMGWCVSLAAHIATCFPATSDIQQLPSDTPKDLLCRRLQDERQKLEQQQQQQEEEEEDEQQGSLSQPPQQQQEEEEDEEEGKQQRQLVRPGPTLFEMPLCEVQRAVCALAGRHLQLVGQQLQGKCESDMKGAMSVAQAQLMGPALDGSTSSSSSSSSSNSNSTWPADDIATDGDKQQLNGPLYTLLKVLSRVQVLGDTIPWTQEFEQQRRTSDWLRLELVGLKWRAKCAALCFSDLWSALAREIAQLEVSLETSKMSLQRTRQDVLRIGTAAQRLSHKRASAQLERKQQRLEERRADLEQEVASHSDNLIGLAKALVKSGSYLFSVAPTRFTCNNPHCGVLDTASEGFVLVRGQKCVCGGCVGASRPATADAFCTAARYCCHECQHADRARHYSLCKSLQHTPAVCAAVIKACANAQLALNQQPAVAEAASPPAAAVVQQR